MRPALLNTLFADLASLKGFGPSSVKLFAKLLRRDQREDQAVRLLDVLFHLPSGVIDRRYRCTLVQLPEQGIVTVDVTVGKHRPPANSRMPYRVEVHDGTGKMTLVYFRAFRDHLMRTLPEGESRIISGEVSWFGSSAQMTHPDYIVPPDAASQIPPIEPRYTLTAGLTNKMMMKAAQMSLSRLPAMPEWQDAAWLHKQAWPAFNDAMRHQHGPALPPAMGVPDPARLRLAYDELLANQLALALIRRNMKRARGRVLKGSGRIVDRIIASLPFSLTGSQRRTLAEIAGDMQSGNRMIRLLQGDVGSGKTVVAMLALAEAVEAGTQGAFMAPTEILARQHLATFERLCAGTGMRIALLTGRDRGRVRDETLNSLAEGAIDVLVGTHALFQDEVAFKDLGLAVIDEQHRFGVHQRLALQDKSAARAEVLVMTATPIPRTLALTVYGDMDVSKLTEKPAGRLPIDTRTVRLDRIDEVVEGVSRSLQAGRRVYWVCPLVEEGESDLAAAEHRFASLKERFGGRVGLVHGRLRPAEKDSVMERFKSGEIAVLVATTVIEVGVDVPEAAVMIIENAERFGLAQLHQLRGRVGRGSGRSSCVLLYQDPLGGTAKARLGIMRDTEDGFRIAEEDMRLRGAGEMLGTQQSGVPLFRIADLSVDGELLAAARDDAQLVLQRDPDLKSERGEALRVLLYLFERDEAVKLLAAG